MRAIRCTIASQCKEIRPPYRGEDYGEYVGFISFTYYEEYDPEAEDNEATWSTRIETSPKNKLELDNPHWDFLKEDGYFPYNDGQLEIIRESQKSIEDILKLCDNGIIFLVNCDDQTVTILKH